MGIIDKNAYKEIFSCFGKNIKGKSNECQDKKWRGRGIREQRN